MYAALRTGDLASVVVGCWRFISAAAIEELIQAFTTCVSSSRPVIRDRSPHRQLVLSSIPARASARAAERGHFAILPLTPLSPF